METIKVNMSPNPLDVQTIHASQNDGEARQWGFALHNNGDAIDSSSISDQLVFKSYKGGTEQILPENGAVPVTAPFVGDIKYPDATRTDQEFLYRQSPTEEDGLAKITDIKGNTLVWNQLVPVDETSKSTTVAGVTITDNRDGSYTFTGTATETQYLWLYNRQAIPSFIKPNHRYLIRSMTSDPAKIRVQFILYGDTPFIREETGGNILTTPSDFSSYTDFGLVIVFINGSTFTNEKLYPVLIDLTEMGLDISNPSEFTSLFPLSYYSYNQGSLLSFNGNGIKTTGKNLLEVTLNPGNIINSIDENGYMTSSNNFPVVWQLLGSFYAMPNTQYTISVTEGFTNSYSRLALGLSATISPTSSRPETYADTDMNTGVLEILLPSRRRKTFVSNESQLIYIWICSDRNNTGSYPKFTFACQVEFGSANTAYEPYIIHTVNIPVSTYFPTGMKSAGTAYDELTPIKAITRIGAVDLGTITYTYDGECFIGKLPSDAKVLGANTETLNSVSDRYLINNWSSVKYLKSNMTLGTGVSRYICIFNNSYTDATAFKTAMSGVYLYYELATPTETSFTTASLVTENTEIPLSNEDGVLIGKCTEQLSSKSGFFDAKIKLTDSDGTCYSNKLQLHVERSPQ